MSERTRCCYFYKGILIPHCWGSIKGFGRGLTDKQVKKYWCYCDRKAAAKSAEERIEELERKVVALQKQIKST